MQEVKAYPVGTFSWIDLATTDGNAAKQFYKTLFSWDAEDMPTDEGGNVYTMLRLEGLNVAGLYEMPPDMAKTMPANWFSYISVDDAAAYTQKARELGATIIQEPFQAMEHGHAAVIQDPTGAVFGLWQPLQHIGAQLVNRPNTLVWNHLATRDVEAANTFYTQLFGWEAQVHEAPPSVAFINQGRMAASAMLIGEDWGDDIPPHWEVYFDVEDCDAIVAKAQELGGTAVMPPMDMEGIGRFCLLQDPQGAHFYVVKSAVVDPPPGYDNN